MKKEQVNIPKRKRGRPPGSSNNNNWKSAELPEGEKKRIIEYAKNIGLLHVSKKEKEYR